MRAEEDGAAANGLPAPEAATFLAATADPGREMARLLAAFAALPPLPDPLDALYAALPNRSLTYDCLLALDDELRQAVHNNDDETEARHGVIRQCYHLPPIPLSAAPLGY